MKSETWPPFQLGSQSCQVCIFQDLSVEEIVKKVVAQYDFKQMKYLSVYLESPLVGEATTIDPKLHAVIKTLKKKLTAFFILFEKKPSSKAVLDVYYAAGIDGICYLWEDNQKFKEQFYYSVSLWPKGHVFVCLPPKFDNGEKTIHSLVKAGAIPIQDPLYEDVAIIIVKNLEKLKVPLQFIKQVGALGLPLEQGMMDFLLHSSMGRKVYIDLSNLRRQLMVKEVADSFDSAGL